MKLAHIALMLVLWALSGPASYAAGDWQAYDQEGEAKYKAHDYAESEVLLRKAVQAAQAENSQAGLDKSLSDLGWLYTDQKRFADAEPIYNQFLQVRLKAFGATSMKTETAYRLLGNDQHAEGKNPAALTNLLEALKIVEQQPATDATNDELMGVLKNIAVVYKAEGNTTEYQAYSQRAQTLAFQYLQGKHFGNR